MAYMLIRHRVEDFDNWRGVFDDKKGLREENGERSAQVFRNADDPNSVVLLFEWDALANARRYAQDPRLKAAMQQAGVMGAPEALDRFSNTLMPILQTVGVNAQPEIYPVHNIIGC